MLVPKSLTSFQRKRNKSNLKLVNVTDLPFNYILLIADVALNVFNGRFTDDSLTKVNFEPVKV